MRGSQTGEFECVENGATTNWRDLGVSKNVSVSKSGAGALCGPSGPGPPPLPAGEGLQDVWGSAHGGRGLGRDPSSSTYISGVDCGGMVPWGIPPSFRIYIWS